MLKLVRVVKPLVGVEQHSNAKKNVRSRFARPPVKKILGKQRSRPLYAPTVKAAVNERDALR